MSLYDYCVMNDNFEAGDRFERAMAFPCNVCIHNKTKIFEGKCNICGHINKYCNNGKIMGRNIGQPTGVKNG